MREIALSRGFVALVDDEDYERLSVSRWSVMIVGDRHYAMSSKGRLMHRLIVGAQAGQVVDHIDNNPLNNQKTNLRICTQAENLRNRKVAKHSATGVKGVQIHHGSYRVRITCDGVVHRIGTFKRIEDAHRAYCDAAKRLHGEFARFA